MTYIPMIRQYIPRLSLILFWPWCICAYPSSSTRSHMDSNTMGFWDMGNGPIAMVLVLSLDGPFTSKLSIHQQSLCCWGLTPIAQAEHDWTVCMYQILNFNPHSVSVGHFFCPRKLFKHNAAPYSGFLQLQAWITEHRWKLIAGRNL